MADDADPCEAMPSKHFHTASTPQSTACGKSFPQDTERFSAFCL